MVIFWSFFTIILPATYTASLISYLTDPVYITPFETLAQLAQSSSFKPFVLQDSPAKNYLDVLELTA